MNRKQIICAVVLSSVMVVSVGAGIFSDFQEKRSQYIIYNHGNPTAKDFDVFDLPQARVEYEEKISQLKQMVPKLRAQGMSSKDIAHYLAVARKDLDVVYEEAISAEYREERQAKYGNPYYTVESLNAQGRSWEEIIEFYTTVGDENNWYTRSLKGLDWLLSKF